MTFDPPNSYDEYTIGWISCIEVELDAARASLDEMFPSLPALDGDSNHYIFGKISEHNVVIACLPSGIYGTNAAARVATHMQRTFKRLRFGLLVGIGGGVPNPPRYDIRLGDVVVGDPNYRSSGLVQYDMGKANGKNWLERTGALNKPPQELLTAIAGLKVQLKYEHTLLASQLRTMRQKAPDPAGAFMNPGPDKDVLFFADCPHQGRENDCSRCVYLGTEGRPQRQSPDPQIHYGVIGSGNQLIKDSVTRDYWRDQENIVCFEMEAAGLEGFPCAVIRGISDYADSHKNREWQSYAAATAAAYAKLLLSTIPPLQVETGHGERKPERHKYTNIYNSGGGPIFSGSTFYGSLTFQ